MNNWDISSDVYEIEIQQEQEARVLAFKGLWNGCSEKSVPALTGYPRSCERTGFLLQQTGQDGNLWLKLLVPLYGSLLII